MVGGFDTYTVALDSFHHFFNGVVLGYYLLFQNLAHILQLYVFSLGNALHGDTCHHRDYICHFIVGDNVSVGIFSRSPSTVQFVDFFFKGSLMVAIARSKFKVLVSFSRLFPPVLSACRIIP